MYIYFVSKMVPIKIENLSYALNHMKRAGFAINEGGSYG